MSIKTDFAAGGSSPKILTRVLCFPSAYQLFASPEQQAALAERYRAGGMGYGEAKQALFERCDALL